MKRAQNTFAEVYTMQRRQVPLSIERNVAADICHPMTKDGRVAKPQYKRVSSPASAEGRGRAEAHGR